MEGKAKNKLYNVQLSVFQCIETFKRLARKITICFCANKDKRISKLEKAKNVPSKDFVPQIIQSNGIETACRPHKKENFETYESYCSF